MRFALYLAALAAAVTLAPAHAQPVTVDAAKLIRIERYLNDVCRGTAPPKSDEACANRDSLFVMLKASGWCWGREDQAEYQKSWVRCAAPAAAAKPPPVASADTEDNMNPDQQACNLLTAYGFAVADWRNNGVPFERVYANVIDVLRPPLPKWSQQPKQWWLDQYVSVYKDNTGTPPSVVLRRLKAECRASR